jgi:thymidylate synthase
VIGDAHVYKNHVEPLREQTSREPRPFPKLKINPNITKIEDFQMSDLELIGYNPHATISMDMAV